MISVAAVLNTRNFVKYGRKKNKKVMVGGWEEWASVSNLFSEDPPLNPSPSSPALCVCVYCIKHKAKKKQTFIYPSTCPPPSPQTAVNWWRLVFLWARFLVGGESKVEANILLSRLQFPKFESKRAVWSEKLSHLYIYKNIFVRYCGRLAASTHTCCML